MLVLYAKRFEARLKCDSALNCRLTSEKLFSNVVFQVYNSKFDCGILLGSTENLTWQQSHQIIVMCTIRRVIAAAIVILSWPGVNAGDRTRWARLCYCHLPVTGGTFDVGTHLRSAPGVHIIMQQQQQHSAEDKHRLTHDTRLI